MIFKKSVKRYECKMGSYFLEAFQILTSFQVKQPVKTSASVSSCNSEGEACAPFAGGAVKIHWASCACAQKPAVLVPPLWQQCKCLSSAFVRAPWMPQVWSWVQTLDSCNFPTTGLQQEHAPSKTFSFRVNIEVVNSFIHLTPESYWSWRTKEGDGLTGWCSITEVWAEDLRLSRFTLDIWLELEYLFVQTSAACHIRLYYIKLCHSGTLSDALYIFTLTDLKGVNQWNQWQWIWGRKKKCFLTQHRNLLS